MDSKKQITSILLIGLIFCSSCKVYKKVDWIKPQIPKEERSKFFEPRQLGRISEGDSLYIKTKDSISFDMIYATVRNDSIHGLFWQKNNRKIKIPIESGIPISDIQMIKVRKFDWVTTIALGLGIPFAVFIYFLINPFQIDLSGLGQIIG